MKNLLARLFAAAALLGAVSAAVAATLVATLNVNIVASYRGSNDLGAVAFALTDSLQPSIRLDNGTGAGQADLMFADTRTLAASATENLDLAGSLVDPVGSTLTFVTIKVIKVCAATGNTNNVLIGGAASNTMLGIFDDATDIVRVKPGGCFIWIAPKVGATVTASTGDILKAANSSSGTSVTYDIIIIGTSA